MKALIIQTLLFLFFAIPSSIMDIRRFRIPMGYVCLGILVLAAFRIFNLFTLPNLTGRFFWYQIIYLLVAVITSTLVFLCTRLLSAGGLGWGDLIFGILAAIYSGFYGNLVSIAFAALSGILFYLLLRIIQKHSSVTNVAHPVFAVPFVPFITFGALLEKFLALLM